MVKPGYKQTEAGVIPEGWEVKSLGECLTVRPSYGINAPAVPFSDRLPTYIRITDITDDGKFSPRQYVSVNSSMAKNYYLSDGDIVFARTGASVGKSYQYTSSDGPLVYAGFLIRVKIDENIIISSFAAMYVKTGGYWRWVRLMSMRSGQPGINGKEYSLLPVPIPPPPEQYAIAAALRDVDALLSGLDLLIVKKRDLKQAAMQKLLKGEARLPGFSGEWDKVRLGDMFSFKNGLNKAKRFFGYGTPIINYMDVFNNSSIHLKNIEGLVSVTFQEVESYNVKKGDVLFTRTSETVDEIGISSTVLYNPTDTVFSGFLLRARPLDGRLDDKFKSYCFKSTFVRKQIISKASYTTRALTNGRVLSEIELPFPPLAEQSAIATVLSDMDAELAALENRRDKTRALKQAMMQELLTGKTRLV